MIPNKSIYESRLNNGGDIANPEVFSIISSCLFNIPPNENLSKESPEDIEIEGCLILQNFYYSLKYDEHYNLALGIIELQQEIKTMYPKQSLCQLLAYQKNPECEMNPLKQKKIQVLYEKEFGFINQLFTDKQEVNTLLINPKEIEMVIDIFSHASSLFRNNKAAECDLEFLQIRIILSPKKQIRGWKFFIDEEKIDIADINAYLNQTYNNIDPSEDQVQIENHFNKNPLSLYYLYLALGKIKSDNVDKAFICFNRALRIAKKLFPPLSREILLVEYEKFLIDDDEENRAISLRNILNKMQRKFLLGEINKESKEDKQENYEETKGKNYKENEENHKEYLEEYIKEFYEDSEETMEVNNEDNINEEFIINPEIELNRKTIDTIDKIFFAKVLLLQDPISYKSYEKAREILEDNPYDKEKLAHCYYKIAEHMLEILDLRTSYLPFFGDIKIEIFSLEGVEKYLSNAYNILVEAFGKYDFKLNEIVFELIKVHKRLRNFSEAHKFCVIALKIMKIYSSDEDIRIRKILERMSKKKPWNRYLALMHSLYVIEKNEKLKKVFKRKEILFEMINNIL